MEDTHIRVFEQEILIALGSNLGSQAGNPAQTLVESISSLPALGVRIKRISRFFSTPCFPPGAGPDYVNAAAVVTGTQTPADILRILHDVEASFGRERRERWGMRSLDLDLLGIGSLVLPDRATFDTWCALDPGSQRRLAPDRLILPHPRLHERAFVLVPLADVAPDWRHPVLGGTVEELCAALPPEARQEVVPLAQ